MKADRIFTIAAILALSAMMLISGVTQFAPGSEISGQGTSDYGTAVQGTRTGEIGWQYDTFSQNLNVNATPESITTMDQITVTITSEISAVQISQASLYGVVYPEDSFQFPISFPFFKVDTDSSTFRCIIEPFSQFSAYDIEFYIVAYDYFNEPMDSRSSNLYFSYSATGSGWRQDTFDDNIELTYWPLRANATEEVEVTLRSRDNVTIKGANLWVTYETPEGDIEEGGWNFSKTNVNSTEMKQTIPGYDAGTNITFWVIAWDDYNLQITSKFYNYSVMGIVEYTNFPFEYSDSQGNKDVWVPDDVITLSMASICALGIPLLIYLYAVTIRRLKRTKNLIVKKTTLAEPEEEMPGEEETPKKTKVSKFKIGRSRASSTDKKNSVKDDHSPPSAKDEEVSEALPQNGADSQTSAEFAAVDSVTASPGGESDE